MIYSFVLLWAVVVAGQLNVMTLDIPPDCNVGQLWFNGECNWMIPEAELLRDNRRNYQDAGMETRRTSEQPKVYCFNGHCTGPLYTIFRRQSDPDYLRVIPLKAGSRRLLTQNKVSAPNRNIITAPKNCPAGQQLVNGYCRNVWDIDPLPHKNGGSKQNDNDVYLPAEDEMTIIPLPNENGGSVQTDNEKYSPAGKEITEPPNCPYGLAWINMACREIWRSVLRDNIAIRDCNPICLSPWPRD